MQPLLLSALVLGLTGAADGDKKDALKGAWTAVAAERDGKAADDLVGHRLTFTGDQFEIQSKDGKLLYRGTCQRYPDRKPAAVDFRHTEGPMKGKVWKGIYEIDGDTLQICDNAMNPEAERPTEFTAKSGSGRVLVRFRRR